MSKHRRRALIIANQSFDSDDFSALNTPKNNAMKMAQVLRQLGGFEIRGPLVDKSSPKIREAVATLFGEAKFGDTILLYYSGHGETDDRGRYYLITRDSRQEILDATAVDARFIHERMKSSKSKSLIVVLDSCYSASFIEGALSEPTRVVLNQFSRGRGRVILTSSGPTQLSFEGIGEDHSVFTSFLLKGLETKAADVDRDGYVSAEEWFDYAEREICVAHPKQSPLASFNLQKGNIYVARVRDNVSPVYTLQSSPPSVLPRPVPKLAPEQVEQEVGDNRLEQTPVVELGVRENIERLSRKLRKALFSNKFVFWALGGVVATIVVITILGLGGAKLYPASTPLPTTMLTSTPTTTVTRTTRPTRTPTATQATGSTQKPTSTPLVTPPPTRTTNRTPVTAASSPTLLKPANGIEYRNPNPFQWQGTLSAGQTYRVTIRHVASNYAQRSDLLAASSWTAHLPAEKYGEWRWKVSVVQDEIEVATSDEWMFWFAPFSSSPLPTPSP